MTLLDNLSFDLIFINVSFQYACYSSPIILENELDVSIAINYSPIPKSITLSDYRWGMRNGSYKSLVINLYSALTCSGNSLAAFLPHRYSWCFVFKHAIWSYLPLKMIIFSTFSLNFNILGSNISSSFILFWSSFLNIFLITFPIHKHFLLSLELKNSVWLQRPLWQIYSIYGLV